MKRSEMLKIIEYCWADSTSFKSDKATSEYILKKIEEAGMKPPYNSKGLTSYGIAMGDDTYTWEPEDD